MKIHRPPNPLRTPGLILFLGLAITPPANAAQGYHLWYDENGQAVYSQFAPGDGRASETLKPPPPPAEEPEAARQRLEQRLQRFADKREDKALAREKAASTRSESEQARQRCEQARRNLEVLNGRPRQLYKSSDGTVRRMDEEQRQAQRAEMEKIIATDCR